ncbi:MAG: hypothetical protein CSA33_09030 [Desulfobulbus propionicus]|nr:MAG: hypothetical protein CSA33_09030 [Desulfobulbus propionicus]
MLKQELLDILACPKCKGPVELDTQHTGLLCRPCKLLYAIKDGIPIMLVDEAKSLGEREERAQERQANDN